MGLRITFDLTSDDLKHFRLIMAEARTASAGLPPAKVIGDARALLDKVRGAPVPEFIQQRLDKLELLVGMVVDEEWKLPEQESSRVLNALAYFCEPEDLIPDHVPGLGFLDDAIMIELVARELRHEIDAYRDFCEFREREEAARRRSGEGDVTREDWLKARRLELQSRMRRRRLGERKRRDDSGRRSPLQLF